LTISYGGIGRFADCSNAGSHDTLIASYPRQQSAFLPAMKLAGLMMPVKRIFQNHRLK
jgi:hypothetical protein